MGYFRSHLCLMLVLLSALLSGKGAHGGNVIDLERLEGFDAGPYVAYLEESGLPPMDYVTGQFAGHQVVMLGEHHGVRENCAFVADLIGPVYHKARVRHFVTEFVPTRLTGEVNLLVTAPSFDRGRAIELMRQHAWPTWGYEEYLGILEAVWTLNSSLPDDAEPMKVIGLDSDWSQHDLLFKHTDPADSMRVMMERERHMVDVFRSQVIEPGHMALAHMGYAHSITCHGVRLGTVLTQAYGDRVRQVVLHHAFMGEQRVSTVQRLVEIAVAENGGTAVGFDVLGSPWGRLRDPGSMAYTFGGKRSFADLAQGYVVLKPLNQLTPVRWIDGFIIDETFQEALEVSERLGWADPDVHSSPAKLDARLKVLTESR